MSWQGIHGHDNVVDQFRRSIAHARLGNTFLFVGPAGIGKFTFAIRLAQSLLCPESDQPLSPCGTCPSCVQVLAHSHLDLDIVSRPKDKRDLPIELLIGDKEHRMREGLCARIAMRPSRGDRKIGIIDDADHLNQHGANCLLKTLEEPPVGSVLILIATSPQRQLPTIRSRAQMVRFAPLSTAICERLLLEKGMVEDPAEAARLARLGSGSLSRAIAWSDPALETFRKLLYEAFSQPEWAPPLLARSIAEFVDSAGKEAPKRRARLRQVIQMAEQYFASVGRALAGAPPRSDGSLNDALLGESVRNTLEKTQTTIDGATACVQRCHSAAEHLDANANQATNIEAWIDDLATGLRHPLGGYNPWAIH